MDLQKEREAFETWLYSTEKFKCRNKIFLFMLDENGCYEDNPVLEHWETWQATKAQAVPEQVLDAPACVGGGTFQKGVKWSTVIAAAQRHFKYTQNAKKAPSLDIDQVKKLVSGDFVLVEKSKVRIWYQDDEPENFCNSEFDLDTLGDCLDDDDIIVVNIHESAHISTRKVFGVWKSNSPTDIQSKFILVDSHEEAEKIVASNKAMIEAQEQKG